MDSTVTPAPPQRFPEPSAALTLLKPITWFAPMWAFMCGVVSAGAPILERWEYALLGIVLAGPLVCAASQAVNDWFDRHVDAINEPDRPIPSGRIPGRWGLYIAILWTGLSALLALALGPWVAVAAAIGLVLAWIYSAPPLRLKMNGWTGAAACAVGYEGIPWFTGAAVMLGGFPPWEIVAMAGLYSLGAHGIMTLNDFKAVEGDRAMGIKSLPVTLGVDRAAKLACYVMAIPQIAVFVLLAWLDAPFYAAGIGLLFAAQIALMPRLLSNPKEQAAWYNATGTSLYVLGMLLSAFALASALDAPMGGV